MVAAWIILFLLLYAIVAPIISPYKIAGSAWKSPATYYYLRGKITPGDKIDEKSIESGTLIFYKAPAK